MSASVLLRRQEIFDSSCCLDHLIVAKGTSTVTCVFGATDNGIQHGILAANYILCKMLMSQRYKRVICLCLDRRADSVISSAKSHFEQLQIVNSKQLTSAGSIEILMKKLRTVEGSISGAHDLKSVLNDFIDEVSHDNPRTREDISCLDDSDADVKCDSECITAVLVYSLSELMLTVGTKKAIAFINHLKAAAQEAQKRTAKTSPVSLVALVHSSLHSVNTLSSLLPRSQNQLSSSSPFNASVRVTPNDGSISSHILCEVQVVKVSNVTGKVTEGSNYFTESPGLALLVPIPKSKARDVQESMSEATSSSVVGGGGGVSSATFGSTAEEQSKNKNREGSAVSGSVKSNFSFNRRLITLDSTDPEFDEDSDPDADLDI